MAVLSTREPQPRWLVAVPRRPAGQYLQASVMRPSEPRQLMHLTVPSIPALRDRCAGGAALLISAPFFSREGLTWIEPAPAGKVEIWTRLNPYEWATGVSDPPALLEYARRVGPGDVSIHVHRALHAKIYRVDDAWAWIGSPNLSRAAFQTNIELVAELDSDEVSELDELIQTLREGLRPVSLDDLEAVVDVASDAVRTYEDAEVPEDLLAAVRLVDEVLAPRPTLTHPERIPDLDDFIRYVRAQRGSIAEEIVAQHFGKQSRQGHVKQSYYAIALFLSDDRGRAYDAALRELSLNAYPTLPSALIDDWVTFLDENATHKDDDRAYAFSTLRNVLPERLGGYTTGGGGASGTLTRVFPLVAHFLND